jgi:soluble lytic murein transglycosylase-like protein
VQDSFEPGENVRGGSAYLDALLTRYHDKLALALAAYNAGPQAVDKYHGIPPYQRDQGLRGARDSRVQSARAGARSVGQARELALSWLPWLRCLFMRSADIPSTGKPLWNN